MNGPRRASGWTLTLRLCCCAFVSPAILAATAPSAPSLAQSPGVIHQLRIYEIFEHNKKAFHDRFRDHALRIMTKYDFNIVAMWESKYEGRTEFVYLIEWPDAQTMRDRWAQFMADKEWSAIKKETGAKYGDLVGDIQDRTLHLTAYSPHQALLSDGAEVAGSD